MGITLYQSISTTGRPQTQEGTSLCGGSRQYQIKKWCGIRRSTWLLTLYILAYFTFLVGGSILFAAIENESEADIKSDIELKKQAFVYKHPDVTEAELEDLIQGINYRGISPLKKDFNSSNWSFGQSFLFSVTLVTTIGYGHINPVSPYGKMTCILFALLGIPFTLVFLSALVQRLLSPTYKIFTKLMARLPNMDSLEIRLMHLAVLGTFLFIFAFLVPSVIFWWLEPAWSFLDCIYFVFISLTTIGLGDYIPGDNDQHEPFRDIYKTVVGIYLLCGLVLLSLTLTVYYDIPQLNLGLHLHRHRDIFEDATHAREHKDSELSTATVTSRDIEEGETNGLVPK